MNSVNFGWFILSQTIYNIGAFAIMSSLFQLRFKRHVWKISTISFLNGIINYLIYFNEDIHIGYLAPIVSILITFLYSVIMVKIPTIWSFIVTVTGGTIVPMVIQLGIIFGSFGYFTPAALKEHIWRNYAIDITSGLVYCLLSVLLYFQGWSFKFDFDKIRFKWERRLIIILTVCTTVFLPLTIIFTNINKMSLSLTFLTIMSFLLFSFLLGYAFKKEQDEIKYLKPIKEVKIND